MLFYFFSLMFLSVNIIAPSFSAEFESDIIKKDIIGYLKDKGVKEEYFLYPGAALPPVYDKKVKKEIRKFVNEEIDKVPPHEFFSINRFSKLPYDWADYEEKDKELIENWRVWYIGKSFIIGLGGKNAKKELDIVLESKIEFFENISFMINDQLIASEAKKFYEKQLISVNKLPSE